MVGGANFEGSKDDHIYNVTKEEIEKIVDIFVDSVEEILREFGVQYLIFRQLMLDFVDKLSNVRLTHNLLI